MKSFVIIKSEEVRLQITDGFRHTLILFDVYLLIFDVAPESFHKNGVECSSSAISTNPNSSCPEPIEKLATGKLHSLIRIKNLWRRSLQGAIQCVQTKTRI